MESLFAAVNAVLSFITPVSDFFWEISHWPSLCWSVPGFISHSGLDLFRYGILRRESGFWCTGAGPIQGFPLWRPSF